MRCTKYAAPRAKCIQDLLNLPLYPVNLTTELALGVPPPPPLPNRSLNKKSALRKCHDQCLSITGTFLNSIDKISRL
jgi:hypothetical protein